MSQPTALRDAAAALADEMVELRHALHAEPEVGLDLPKTQRAVLAAIDGLDLKITTGSALSSVTAVLSVREPGPTVLLRADMDALRLQEDNGLPYASRVPGVMHACGHDLHTAMLVGAVRLLSTVDFAGKVVFMFQPGEEGHGGAELMIREGVLTASGERPVAAYAVHVIASLLPKGMFVSRPGPILAACDALRVTVRGVGGHSALPSNARDPIPAACEMVTALQTNVTRSFDVFDPVVVTVPSFHAGAAENAIPDEANFTITARSFSRPQRDRLNSEMLRVLNGIADAHGLTLTTERTVAYPVTVNDHGEAAFLGDVAREVFGSERFFEVPRPLPASEDFSYVLDEIPGAFVALGACPGDVATAGGNHSAGALFDDDVLPDGAALYAELAVRRLQRGR
jgi:amidohydrolase